jgi:L-threonylcarbamoyladenylate synthase
MSRALTAADIEVFERCLSVGGVAVFPSDTVYGVACDAAQVEAVHRLYSLKRRGLETPSAVMFFSLDLALASLPELGARSEAALHKLLPGAVTLLLDNPAGRFPLACGDQPATLGLRVPQLDERLAALAAINWPVLQSSANSSGEPAPVEIDQLAEEFRDGVDLVLDAGPLSGTSSTIVDLRGYELQGTWSVLREGPVGLDELTDILG